MARRNKIGAEKFALGAAIAALGGYLAGILTAPKSGKETRSDLADKAVDVKDSATEDLESARDELDELLDRAKDKTFAAKAKSKDEFNEAMVRARDARAKATEIIKAVKSGTADDPELNKAVNQARQAAKNLGKYLKK